MFFLLFATRAGGVGLKNLLNKSHHDDAFNVKRISYLAGKKSFGTAPLQTPCQGKEQGVMLTRYPCYCKKNEQLFGYFTGLQE